MPQFSLFLQSNSKLITIRFHEKVMKIEAKGYCLKSSGDCISLLSKITLIISIINLVHVLGFIIVSMF